MMLKKSIASTLGALFVSSFMMTGCSNDDNDTVVIPVPTGTSVESITFLTDAVIPNGTMFEGTTIGGISGVTYDAKKDLYYAIVDDRSSVNPARFYTFKMDLTKGYLISENIIIQSVVTLLREDGTPYPEDTLDPESIALTANGNLLISSEGDAGALVNPFVNEYTPDGKFVSALPIDAKYLPNKEETNGVRGNRAFEGLTISPDMKTVYVSAEDTLQQDGPSSGIDQKGISRFMKYDYATKTLESEFLYSIDGYSDRPDLNGFGAENSVADILAIDDHGTFLVLERYYSWYYDADGNEISGLNSNKLYEIKTQGLDQELSDVKDLVSVKGVAGLTMATKRLVYDFNDTFANKDDFESLVFGPLLPDGSQSLISMSDNDFQDGYDSQFLLFSIQLSK